MESSWIHSRCPRTAGEWPEIRAQSQGDGTVALSLQSTSPAVPTLTFQAMFDRFLGAFQYLGQVKRAQEAKVSDPSR